MEEQIKKIIDEEIKPALAVDGGSIAFIGVDGNGVVQVQLQGACHGCPGAQMTLKMGVERILKEKVAGVSEVVAV